MRLLSGSEILFGEFQWLVEGKTFAFVSPRDNRDGKMCVKRESPKVSEITRANVFTFLSVVVAWNIKIQLKSVRTAHFMAVAWRNNKSEANFEDKRPQILGDRSWLLLLACTQLTSSKTPPMLFPAVIYHLNFLGVINKLFSNEFGIFVCYLW